MSTFLVFVLGLLMVVLGIVLLFGFIIYQAMPWIVAGGLLWWLFKDGQVKHHG